MLSEVRPGEGISAEKVHIQGAAAGTATPYAQLATWLAPAQHAEDPRLILLLPDALEDRTMHVRFTGQ
jgi:hypothetical protein